MCSLETFSSEVRVARGNSPSKITNIFHSSERRDFMKTFAREGNTTKREEETFLRQRTQIWSWIAVVLSSFNEHARFTSKRRKSYERQWPRRDCARATDEIWKFLKGKRKRHKSRPQLEQPVGSYSQIKDVLVETRSNRVMKSSTAGQKYYIRTPTHVTFSRRTGINFTLLDIFML